MTADLEFAALTAPLDPRLSPHDRAVLAVVFAEPATATMDELCNRFPNTPREHVFAAVARLEDYGLLTKGSIR